MIEGKPIFGQVKHSKYTKTIIDILKKKNFFRWKLYLPVASHDHVVSLLDLLIVSKRHVANIFDVLYVWFGETHPNLSIGPLLKLQLQIKHSEK